MAETNAEAASEQQIQLAKTMGDLVIAEPDSLAVAFDGTFSPPQMSPVAVEENSAKAPAEQQPAKTTGTTGDLVMAEPDSLAVAFDGTFSPPQMSPVAVEENSAKAPPDEQQLAKTTGDLRVIAEPDSFAVAFGGSSASTADDAQNAPPPPRLSPTKNASERLALLPLDSSAWETDHTKLCDYESTRRSAYRDRLEQISAYWSSVCSLMHGSIDETVGAERMLKGAQSQAAAYAKFLKASSGAEGHGLDEAGRPIVASDEKKARRFNLSPSKTKDVNEGADKDPAPNVASGGIFHPLYACNGAQAEHFANFATFVGEAIAEVSNILQGLVEQVEPSEKLGHTLRVELEAAEAEVVEAWRKYHEAATKLLSPEYFASEERRRGASLGDIEATAEFVGECEDLWVVEMRYRMAVEFLSSCWEKSSDELLTLFSRFKHAECNRRLVLRNFAVSYANLQDQLWAKLSSITASAHKDVTGKAEEHDLQTIENEVRNAIRIGAQSVQKEEDEDDAEDDDGEKNKEDGQDDGGGNFGPGLEEVDEPEGGVNYNPPSPLLSNLQSPLLSNLIVKADLIEIKGGGVMGRWKTVLAIITTSSFLHVLNLPKGTKVSKDAGPEFAFHALVPSVEIATEEAPHVTPLSKQVNDWFVKVKPIDSFALPNSSISFVDVADDHIHQCFEITEKVESSGAQRMIRSTGSIITRKVLMRVSSKDEEKAWTQALSVNK